MNIRALTVIYVVLTLWSLSSCVPNQDVSSSRNTRGRGATTSTDNNPAPPPDDLASIGNVSWYSQNQNFNNIITLNEDIQTVVYLRGEAINNFLSSKLDGTVLNQDRTYCLVASFNNTNAKKNFRSRAVPISFFNFEKQTQERLLRIDLPDSNSSSATCSGDAYQIITTPDAGISVGNTDSTFSLPDLCSNCAGIINSTNVSLYLANSPLTVNDRIPESGVNIKDLILRIDTQSGSLDQGGQCSQSGCLAKGFDCCLDGQCVMDGALRPNASTQLEFTQAVADVAESPDNFKNWPSIYFVCGSTPPPPTPTFTPFPDAQATADARLEELIKDYNCLEEGKNLNPNFSGNNVCEPNFDQASYESVRAKVWSYCGCKADPFPVDPDDPVCPDFGLQATKDALGNITDITCFTPPPSPEATPFQSLSLPVSTKAAPHRFYRADNGESVDDITTLSEGVLPEGLPFQYLNDSSKTDPDCSEEILNGSSTECSYNFNSIIGQFKVDLTQAEPAVVVNLDFDQSYIITTSFGYYTPCPTCAADYWFQSFSAFPSTQDGVGLQAVGYQTNRETFGLSSSQGNYEDTHFGRACFLPPTMLPFSQAPNPSVVTQRRNRLLTQTALWMNGYQRDWFGFNKGALIGSFDGVNWFAIGKSRRVVSKSNKLFLAINAPFADLADPSSLTVQVILDQGFSIAPAIDFDPNLSPDSPEQNTAASCQYWHQCETDTDCVTKLGWEYMCIDTSNFKTRWPKFDAEANEVQNQDFDNANFNRVIEGGIPIGPKKRCTYRGAGALCKRDYTRGLVSNRRKMFACAPNFHCANLNSSEFSDKIARTPNKDLDITLGMEADILGRPLDYTEANSTLPIEVQNNIELNGALYTSEISDLGLCRPGRLTDITDPIRQHEEKDSFGRTDYIGQVGVCNSNITNLNRTIACPIFENDEGQLTAKGDLLLAYDSAVNDFNEKSLQNSCGNEGVFNNNITIASPFSTIEADPIRFLNNLVTKSVARDGCLRRAGSVCHTDLDCGPNRLHQNLAFAQSKVEFGGTEAELKYWQEGLVCGQAAEEPLPSSDDYFDYDMSKNRCCRETGKDFTMYTQVTYNNSVANPNPNLNVTAFAFQFPTLDGRYSRYASVGTIDDASKTANDPPYPQAPIVNIRDGLIPRAYQWKTLNDTGENTCCGGGWIRKFADGSTAWDDPRKLQIDPTNFSCLNYSSELVFLTSSDFSEYIVEDANYFYDANRFCLFPTKNGCAQIQFGDPTTNGNLVTPSGPEPSNGRAVINTKPDQANGGTEVLSPSAPYPPVPYANPTPINLDGSSDKFIYFASPTDYFGVSFYLPVYVGYFVNNATSENGGVNNLISVRFQYFDQSDNFIGETTPTDQSSSCTINQNPRINLADNQFCINANAPDNVLVFHGRADTTLVDSNGDPWSYASVRLEFNTFNGNRFIYGSGVDPDLKEGMLRGNDLYYLTKLGRLELLGIPQIPYEPIFCNSNNSKLVGGIFSNMIDRSSFEAGSFSMANNSNQSENGRPLIAMYDDRYTSVSSAETARYNVSGVGNVNDRAYRYDPVLGNDFQERFVFHKDANNQDIFSLPVIFSENEFRCCAKLGQKTSESAKCCSGYQDPEDKTCKLPSGADLHVYFNKFVSSEGIGEDLPGGGLTDDDFIPETGEPKIDTTVLSKIRQLGDTFCASGATRAGGSFGFFTPEPNSGIFVGAGSADEKRYSIVDSTRDNDTNNLSGFSDFINGFRWDHHLYCDF